LFGAPKSATIQPFNCTVKLYTDYKEYKNETGRRLGVNAICQTSMDGEEVDIFIQDSTCLDHEIIHATWFIFRFYRVPLEEEFQAYYFEYIKRELLKP
jgi:hypothetical protein